MPASDLKPILHLYTRPAAAMSDLLDRGSLFLSSVAVLAISFALSHITVVFPFPFYGPLFGLAAIYVPGLLFIGGLISRLSGGFHSVFQRDYAPLLTCVAAAWSATNLPLLAIAWFAPAIFLKAALLAYAWLLVLIFFAVRTVFGTESGPAFGIVALSWAPLLAAYLLRGPLEYLAGWLFSPFLLIYAYFFLRGEISGMTRGLGEGLRRSQSFRRNLEAAAVNPHDAEAQYQLGLIYQQRRQYTEAMRRFENSIAIDPGETDAHFQLGRIALEQGRLADALRSFQTVVNQNEQHAQSAILRELGALYISAHQYRDAVNELTRYEELHPYDAEGLYYHGLALEGLGKRDEARELYRRAAEAVNQAPPYLRRAAGKWGRMARRNARKL
ncbi:MAG TPA: tetratricopeptide repeat protein [Bryobacteraceae bacterium]|nr:tetratricopeptide repeat protein [Bryobacteraceae bacterium]